MIGDKLVTDTAPAPEREAGCPVCVQTVDVKPTPAGSLSVFRVTQHSADGKRCAGSGKLTAATWPKESQA